MTSDARRREWLRQVEARVEARILREAEEKAKRAEEERKKNEN